MLKLLPNIVTFGATVTACEKGSEILLAGHPSINCCLPVTGLSATAAAVQVANGKLRFAFWRTLGKSSEGLSEL